MYAIVATGGKQYKVEVGDVIEVEKLATEPGESVALDVVFVADGSTITTDATALATAKVYAEVVEHFKGEKALIFKFKKRKGYKRLRGHRQPLTKLEIIAIALDGAAPKPKKKAAAKKAAQLGNEEKAAKKDLTEAGRDEELKQESPTGELDSETAEDKLAEKPKRSRKKAEVADEAADETAEAADDAAEAEAADEAVEAADEADEATAATE